MTLSIFLQFAVVLAAIWMGSRFSGVGLGLWGAVGLLVLVVAFGVSPTSPPVDVMLIILAVIMAASVMEAAGGIDFLVRVAERIIRANPKYVTIVAPLTTWTFTFVAGTGHIVYPLLPVIYETAHQNGIRPERPMAVATIASQQAITASPVAAATAAMIGLFSEKGLSQWGLPRDHDGLRAGNAHRRGRGRHRVDVHRQGPEGRPRVPGASQGRPDSRARQCRRSPAAQARRQALGLRLPRGCGARRAVRLLPRAAHAPRRQERARHADRDRDPDDVGGGDPAPRHEGGRRTRCRRPRRCAPAWSR